MTEPRTLHGVMLAEGVTIFVRDDGVYIEFRDADGKLFALAGLELEAATQTNERLTDACVEALAHRRKAKAATPTSGALH